MATKKTTTPTPATAKKATKPVAKKAAKKTTSKKATPATVKDEGIPVAAKKTAKKKSAAVKPSLDMIARAAYLNYRRRVEQGLPGNSQGDWLEAERQFSQQS